MGYFFFRIWGKLFIEIFFHFLAYCCHPKSLFTCFCLIFRLEKQLLAWHEISEALLLPSIPKHPIWCFLTGYIQVYISLFTIYWISCLFTFFNLIFFSNFYPAYTPVLQRAVEIWYQDPQVTTPVLKLFAELVQNRSQRLQFDVSSPNGILLFREASKIICTYGKFFSHSLSLKSKKKCNFGKPCGV